MMEDSFVLTVPAQLVENHDLSVIDKLIHSMTLMLSRKGGTNSYSNKYIAELMNIHPNIVGNSRKSLVEKGYETKSDNTYISTGKYREQEVDDRRDIKIPIFVLKAKIPHGAKMLWGEFNTFREKGYKAGRKFACKRLNCSLDTITNWTNHLLRVELLDEYHLIVKDGKKQRIVTTKNFKAKFDPFKFEKSETFDTSDENIEAELKSSNKINKVYLRDLEYMFEDLPSDEDYKKYFIDEVKRARINGMSELEIKTSFSEIVNKSKDIQAKRVLADIVKSYFE